MKTYTLEWYSNGRKKAIIQVLLFFFPMSFLLRLLQRILVAIVVVLVLWFIVTQIFDRLDQRLPLFFALLITYVVASYFVLPWVVHIGLLLTKKNHLPRFTVASDGFPVDPVNIIFFGDKTTLAKAFAEIGWSMADPLYFRSSLKMVRAFLFKEAYPTAPFSSLFLFGRKQDFGFQEDIANNPRQRHHIRIWATDLTQVTDPFTLTYWQKELTINPEKATIFIGAASRDTGIGLTKLTFQVSHHVAPNRDAERDFVITSLKQNGNVKNVRYFAPEELQLGTYTLDGKIATVELK